MVGLRHGLSPRRGFTILELVLALTLVSVVASVAIPAYFDRGDVTLENAAVLLARDMRAAQNRSAYLGEPSRIEFYADGTGYRATTWKGRIIRNPRTEEAFVRDYSQDGVFEGVRFHEVDMGDEGLLRFDGRGRALDTGTVVLGYGVERRTLLIEEGTGKIRILGSTSGWNDLGY